MNAAKRRRRYKTDQTHREKELARKAEWRKSNPQTVTKGNLRYDSSLAGLIRRFKYRYNAKYSSAARLAKMVLDDYCRCSICGIPNWLIKQLHQRGGPFPHVGQRLHRNTWARMHVDHIEPGGPSTKGNTRPLCPACNIYRGAARRSDTVVLARVRWWWRDKKALRFLWWLNTSPGKGGRLHRSKATHKRRLTLEAM